MATGTVTADVLEEPQTVEKTRDGWTATRSFLCSNISGAETNAVAYRACGLTGVPVYGTAHPTMTALVLVRLSAKAIDTDKVRITCNYAQWQNEQQTPDSSQAPMIEAAASVAEVDTNFDYYGELLKVTYNSKEQTGVVKKLVPHPVLRMRRLEPAGTDIIGLICSFVGFVNASSWHNYPAGTWLCRDIQATLTNDGALQMTYEFQYNEANWNSVTVAYQDENGRVPNDAVIGNGLKNFAIYPTTNFYGLNL